MFWHFYQTLGTAKDSSQDNVHTTKIEIVSQSMTASCIAFLCLLTMLVNIWVCYRIYSKRSLRSSCTALIVANIALVDILVSIKDLPFLLSVALSSKWYFETEWCRSYGLTNVVYIIVSVSTLVSIATDRYIVTKENSHVESGKFGQYSSQGPNSYSPAPYKVALLGYVVAQTTLSYSLTLLWSKYAFISRKAFCQVEFTSSDFPISMIVSFLFLIPIATLTFSMLNSISGEREKTDEIKANSEISDESTSEIEDQICKDESQIHGHLQAAIGIFLLSWCSYVVDSFFPSPQSPSIPGIVSAFIPIMTTSLVPVFFVLTHKARLPVTQDQSKEFAYRIA
ncbi:trace amine-associated receptor 7f-like [Dendronephthya gigantea]|uniref:trace amine-associated receptor 7f-like n=1 Tax=Dendronephthya gigantea TaxID=151771 RepID=UPI00106D052A|nr:trace amine-associated receptor 7f-like [Dendronephthya gigantea]